MLYLLNFLVNMDGRGLSGIMDFIKSTNLVAFFISFLYHKQAFILKEKSEIVLKRGVCSWPFVS